MGVCASKDAVSRSARDLSRWQAGDESAEQAQSVNQAVDSDSDATLNCLAAYRSDVCITGWEDGSVRLQNWKTGAVVKRHQIHSRAVNRLVVGAKTGALYSCSRDTSIAVCSLSTESALQPPVILAAHSLNVSTIAVDDTESSLCSGGRDTQTVLWDLATGQVKAKNTTAQNVITCSKWLSGERVVAQGSEDLSVKLWDERTALRTPVQTLRGYVYFPLSLDVSSDGLYLLTSSKGFSGVGCEARVWDRRTGKQLFQFDGHQQDATACCFLPSNDQGDDISVSMGVPTPVTASKDGSVKVWDVANSAVLCEAHEPSGQMFTGVTYADPATILASTLHGRVHAFHYGSEARTLVLAE